MEFPIEFFALCAALWATYQPTILIWFVVMFAMVVILSTGILFWYVSRSFVR